MTTKLIDLVGHFQRSGAKLSKPGLTLLVSERKNPEPKKTKYFLISLQGNRKDSYISSLFPEGEIGSFWLEYRGTEYNLHLTQDSANISLKTAKRA